MELDDADLVSGLGAENLPTGSQASSEADYRRKLEVRAAAAREPTKRTVRKTHRSQA